MLRVSEAVDRHDKDTFPADFESLDFARALGQNEGGGQREDVGRLWGPGVHEQQSPATIISRKLQIWRKTNVQVSAAKAAEELDKLYASLPEVTAVDLTFQDMVDRNSPRMQRSPGKEDRAAKNGVMSPRASSVVNERFAVDKVQSKHGSKEKENNDPAAAYTLTTKVTPMPRWPTTADVFNPAKPGQLSFEQHERLGGNRLDHRSRTDQLQEGSYSPFTSPSSSFRREQSFLSPKMSPQASFSTYKQQAAHQSLGSEKELARSARDLESRLEDKRARMSSAQDLLPPPESLNHLNGNQLRPVDDLNVRTHINDCSSCPATNLAFRTTCVACGKSFCLTCTNLKTREVSNDRKCKQDCTGRTTKEGLTKTKKRSWKDCWRLFICTNFRYAH